MFYGPKELSEGLPTEHLRKQLALLCSFRIPGQFILTPNNKVACFKNKMFFITDTDFTPQFAYSAGRKILFCGISDSCAFAVIKTQEGNGKTAFTIISPRRMRLVRKTPSIYDDGVTHLFVDDRKFQVHIYWGNKHVILPIYEPAKFDEEKVSKALGMTREERDRLIQQAREEMGTDWEKELDERNRKKAGIEE